MNNPLRHISDRAIKDRAYRDARFGVYRGDRLPVQIRAIYDAVIRTANPNLWRNVTA